MSLVTDVVRGVVGLFVDDELLAVAVLVVVGLAAVLVSIFDTDPLVAGMVLLGGNLLILVAGGLRTARRNRSP